MTAIRRLLARLRQPRLLVAVSMAVAGLAIVGALFCRGLTAKKSEPGVMILPGAAHSSGAGSAQWVTELELFNPTPWRARLKLSFTPYGGGQPVTKRVTVEPKQLKVLGDVVWRTFATSGAGFIQVEAGPEMLVGQRTYNQTASGTFGQVIVAEQARPGTVYFSGLLGGRFRTNLDLVAGREQAVVLSSDLPGLALNQVPAAAGVQLRNLQNRAGFDSAATSGSISAAEPFTSYVSVIDNLTGDPSYYPGTELLTSGLVSGLARKTGAQHSTRSDICFFAPHGSRIEVRYVPFGVGAFSVEPRMYTLEPGATLVLTDVAGPPLGSKQDSAGVLAFTATGSGVATSARTFSEHAGGTQGQSLQAVGPAEYVPPGSAAYFLFGAENQDYRSDLILANPNPGRLKLEVELAGTKDRRTVTVPPRSAVARNRVLSWLGRSEVDHGVLKVSGPKSFTGCLTVLDKRTGDTNTVLPACRTGNYRFAWLADLGFPLADLMQPWWQVSEVRQALGDPLVWRMLLALAVGLAVLQLALLLLARGLGLRLRWPAMVTGLMLPLLLLAPWIGRGRVLVPTCVIKNALPLAPDVESSRAHAKLNDTVYQLLPWEKAVRRALAEGRLPLWSDRLEGGSSPWSNPQACTLCPVATLARLAPIEHHLLVALALKMLVALQGLWLLARLLGAGRAGSLLAGTGFALAGGVISWGVFPFSTAIAWTPWLTVAVIRIFRRPQATAIVTTAVITAALLLAGHPETALAGGLLAATCGLSLSRRGGRLRGLAAATIAAAIGFGLAAPHIIPFMHLIPKSQRVHQKLAKSLSPARPNSWFVSNYARAPQYASNPLVRGRPYSRRGQWPVFGSVYSGLLCFAAAVVAIFGLRRRLLPFLGFAVIAILLVTGFAPLKHVVDAFGVLRAFALSRLLPEVGLCLCVAAALGITRLLSRRPGWAPWIGFAVAAGISLAVARPLVIVLLWTVLLGTAVVARFRPRLAAVFFAVLLITDLLPWARAMLPVGDPALFFPVTPTISTMQDELGEGPGRVVGDQNILYPSLLTMYGMSDVRFHNPLVQGDYAQVLAAAFAFHAGERRYFSAFSNLDHPLLDFLGVRLVAGTEGTGAVRPTLQPIADSGGVWLYRNPDALPPCFLPTAVEVAPRRNRAGEVSGSDVVARVAAISDPRQVVVGAEELAGWVPPGQTWDASAVEILARSPGRLELRVVPGEEKLLATSLTSPDGWRAVGFRPDGARERLRQVRVNHAFLGAILPSGVTRVELRFFPPGLAIGGLAFALSILSALLLVVAGWRRDQGRPTGRWGRYLEARPGKPLGGV